MKKLNLLTSIILVFLSCSLFSSKRDLREQKVQASKEIALSDYNFAGAFVLPVFKTKSGEEMVLLGRETEKDKHGDFVYNALGGTRESNEKHPLFTASREFNEETKEIFFKNLADVRNYIDDKKHTKEIIANSIRGRNFVLYLTYFDCDKIKHIKNFYSSKLKRSVNLEMDKLAWVNKKDLLNEAKGQGPYIIKANIINPDGSEKGETIKLRGALVATLRPFAQGKSTIAKGKDSRVLFYSV